MGALFKSSHSGVAPPPRLAPVALPAAALRGDGVRPVTLVDAAPRRAEQPAPPAIELEREWASSG